MGGHKRFLFSLVIDAMLPQEIIGKSETHVLRAAVAVRAIIEHIALCYGNSYSRRNIKIDAVTNFCHQPLLSAEHITPAQAQTFSKSAAGEYVNGWPELDIAGGIAPMSGIELASG